MCTFECFGDYYRGCQHYVVRYYSGERADCGSPDCKTSSEHRHKTARDCLCPKVHSDNRKVVNMFQFKCDTCMENARARSYR
ncbi:hypothetical protein DFH11DRAFT_1691130 [Phellopilus nigrolimitatus]|nr:hypothetical protein DFH11DRAFT_1691130 [Phellopilus nigrolimitatus]